MKRTLLAGLLALCLIFTMTACGGSNYSKSEAAYASSSPAKAAAPQAAPDYAYAEDSGAMFNGAGGNVTSAQVAKSRKMIFRASVQLETTEFETTASAISALVESYGGYISNSSLGDRGSNYRWAEYSIRIPSENFAPFLNQVGNLCHETWRNTSQDDITESYYDVDGRLQTQKIKLARLQKLLEQAENMEDIITLESAISETEWAIEDLSGTLRHFDDQVAYSTVTVQLAEVYKYSNVEDAPMSYGQRLASSFRNGLRSFGETIEDITVDLAYSWTFLLVLAVIIIVIVRIVRRRRAARREKGETAPRRKLFKRRKKDAEPALNEPDKKEPEAQEPKPQESEQEKN